MKGFTFKQLNFAAIVFTILTALASTTVQANDKKNEIEKLVQTYVDQEQFSGSILVAQNGKVIFSKGYGLANVEWNIPNTTTTKFRIGSLTKQFTSMLVMQLVQEGKVKLDEKITTYLPDYRKDTGDKITVHHLLNHTSGIPSYTSMPTFFKEVSRTYYSVDDFTKEYCSGDLEFEPGSTFRYNNSGYFLLGNIIEKVTGKTYEQALQERIFTPLGMKNTGYDTASPIIKNRASGYQKSLDGLTNAAFLDISLPYAAGSLYSTVEDLFLWDRALYTEKLLNNKYKEIMFTPNDKGYAYGWGIRDIPLEEGEDGDKVASVSHSGGINGFHALITRLSEQQHLVVQLNNTGGAALGPMSHDIAKILHNKPYTPPKKLIVKPLYSSFKQGGAAAIATTFDKLMKHHKDEYLVMEHQLNNFGYQLLQKKEIKGAIEVMKLNVRVHPDSANVHDSLGEVYLADGQKKNALASYEKAFELDPENKHAQEVIEKLKSEQ